MTSNSVTPDSTPAPIQVLFLHFETEHPAPVRAQLLSVAPTFETLGHVLGGPIAPFDAGFMDVIGFSPCSAVATTSPGTPPYPVPGEMVYRLGPVLFAGVQDDIADGATGNTQPGSADAPHSLTTLSALCFQELLDFYLPEMEIGDRLAATRAFHAGRQWNWGELYNAAI